MRYPVAIELGRADAAFGVVIPDLPGCFSAGDTIDEAMTGAEEAVAVWIDTTLDAGGSIPSPSSLEAIQRDPEYSGWTFAIVTIDPTMLDDTIENADVMLPRRVLKRLDARAQEAGESRSGYIARLSLK